MNEIDVFTSGTSTPFSHYSGIPSFIFDQPEDALD